jgi:hypothetical protein
MTEGNGVRFPALASEFLYSSVRPVEGRSIDMQKNILNRPALAISIFA